MGSPSCALAAHDSDLRRWASAEHPAYSRNCQTSTATPAEPGDLPGLLALLFSLSSAFAILSIFAAAANGCLQRETSTDRSDVTNSRIVVPVGSLQSEIGVNVSAPDGVRILDGINSRLRVGVAPCVEVLVDCRPIMELGSG